MRAPINNWTQMVAAAAFACIACVWAAASSPVHAQAGAAPAQAAGSGIWSGIYTDDQAKRGEAVSSKSCDACHGTALSGGEAAPALVGIEFLGNWTSLSLGDLFDRVRTTMPADSPGSLSVQETSDLIAYVLKLNSFPQGEHELPTDMPTLGRIKIEGQPPAK